MICMLEDSRVEDLLFYTELLVDSRYTPLNHANLLALRLLMSNENARSTGEFLHLGSEAAAEERLVLRTALRVIPARAPAHFSL